MYALLPWNFLSFTFSFWTYLLNILQQFSKRFVSTGSFCIKISSYLSSAIINIYRIYMSLWKNNLLRSLEIAKFALNGVRSHFILDMLSDCIILPKSVRVPNVTIDKGCQKISSFPHVTTNGSASWSNWLACSLKAI